MIRPEEERIYPRYSTDLKWNPYFSALV